MPTRKSRSEIKRRVKSNQIARTSSSEPRKGIRTTQYLTKKDIEGLPNSTKDAYDTIRQNGFQVPRRPDGDLDELLERYYMPEDMSEVQSFEQLRAMMSFYTGEAARANISYQQHKAEHRDLLRQLKRRTASLVGDMKRIPKWQVELSIADDKKIIKFNDAIEIELTVIDIMKSLSKTYGEYSDTLSREISARISDREKWQGRAGSGR